MKYKNQMDEMKSSMFKDGYSVRFYRGLDDFHLKIDDKNPAPDWLMPA